MLTASCTLVSSCAQHNSVATSITASATARDASHMHHRHKQMAVPDLSTYHLALLDNEPSQGCLDPGTCCCIYCNNCRQQYPSSHGPIGQSYGYGNANVLCEVQHAATIVHDNTTAVHNYSCNNIVALMQLISSTLNQ